MTANGWVKEYVSIAVEKIAVELGIVDPEALIRIEEIIGTACNESCEKGIKREQESCEAWKAYEAELDHVRR